MVEVAPARRYVMVLGQSNAHGYGVDAGGKCFGPERGFVEAWSAAHRGERLGVLKVSLYATSMIYWQPGGDLLETALSVYRFGGSPKVVAVLWVQGEADMVYEHLAQRYFERSSAALRMIRDITRAPIVMAHVVCPGKPFETLVRAEQDRIARSGLATLVETSDLSRYGDGVHLDAAGQMELGRRMYAAISP